VTERMAEYFYNKRVRNAPIRRRLDRRFVSWVMVSACVGAVVASGFVYSARCHFEAVSLGYETEQRRAELVEQEERRRQLEFERVKASAPEEIEQRARRLGLREPEPAVRQREVAP
jgi:coenzyme F420-reducing hydrogenase delta subunit